MKLSNNEGFTMVGILVATIIVGILAAVAIPIFSQYKGRAYDADTKANMHNLYLACKAYWGDHGTTSGCSVPTVSGTTYGYMQSTEVSVSATGSERMYSAVGSHSKTTNTFTMNWVGIIN